MCRSCRVCSRKVDRGAMADFRIEPLEAKHGAAGFASGVEALDRWFREHAGLAERSGSARTFVAAGESGEVIGFYSLAVCGVVPAEAPARMRRGMPAQPLPAALLARLAVDRSWQGRGLGAALLRDALLRVVGIAEEIGLRAVLVDAKNEAAATFYEHFGFERFPPPSQRLFLLLKDLRKSMG